MHPPGQLRALTTKDLKSQCRPIAVNIPTSEWDRTPVRLEIAIDLLHDSDFDACSSTSRCLLWMASKHPLRFEKYPRSPFSLPARFDYP